MKRTVFAVITVAMVVFAPYVNAAPVEYARLCPTFGAGFFYIPGTDSCMDPVTGDTRVLAQDPFSADVNVWRTILPYPEGKWTTNVQSGCAPGKAVKLGTYKSTDFALNHFGRGQTAPVKLSMKSNEFISQVIMSGGFYDPRLAQGRQGVNTGDALCVRSIDPTRFEKDGATLTNPPFGNGGLPVGCISRTRITGMPASYVINATAAYQSTDMYFNNAEQTDLAGPYVYGTQLVVTTDWQSGHAATPVTGLLVYHDAADPITVLRPLAGTVSVSVCVASGP